MSGVVSSLRDIFRTAFYRAIDDNRTSGRAGTLLELPRTEEGIEKGTTERIEKYRGFLSKAFEQLGHSIPRAAPSVKAIQLLDRDFEGRI
eukprot:6631538-Alexandrium_andersonii.AAC.1